MLLRTSEFGLCVFACRKNAKKNDDIARASDILLFSGWLPVICISSLFHFSLRFSFCIHSNWCWILLESLTGLCFHFDVCRFRCKLNFLCEYKKTTLHEIKLKSYLCKNHEQLVDSVGDSRWWYSWQLMKFCQLLHHRLLYIWYYCRPQVWCQDSSEVIIDLELKLEASRHTFVVIGLDPTFRSEIVWESICVWHPLFFRKINYPYTHLTSV